MTNSMSNVEYVSQLVEGAITVLNKDVIDQYQVAFDINKNDVHHVLSLLKANGWKQLSYLSAVDWLEENEFEVVYILMNWDRAVHVQIRTRLDRENPVIESILPIFEGAKYYERETHEFFGIKFPGNPGYDKQMILENWDDMPPLRKDFDPQTYSDKKFPVRQYTESHVELNNEPSRKVKRQKRRARIAKIRKGGKE